MQRKRQPTVAGVAELTSPLFSDRWELAQDGRTLAQLRRFGRIYASAADLGEGGRILIEPCGRGTVRAIDADGNEIARIERQSWLGRLWEISSPDYTAYLISDPRPRKWHIGYANAPVAEIAGSLLSYNHVTMSCRLAVPIPTLLLAWHVIARPWEAAAEPRGLIPVQPEGDE